MYRRPVSTEEVRLRMQRPGEIFGIVTEMKGGSRMIVQCEDGKERLARIPGRIRRQVWIRVNDYVLITPWPVEGDTRADIAYRYTAVQADQLKKKGILKF
ncbi:MAG: translation initiation factor eIF-1A [Candidatus Micrarchaeota archaeon]|nr:translation initiation factor eIF-1A [Candidatus Micrarchaeota archaeon]